MIGDPFFDMSYRFHNDLQFEIPRWVVISPNNNPACVLTHQDNWNLEEHPAIVGNGTNNLPNGEYALRARYYIKKRWTRINQIQIVALLHPDAQLLAPVNDWEDGRFPRQLMSITCHRPGRIETLDPRSRVIRPHNQHIRPGTCGIEERLYEICLLDEDVGSLMYKDYLFLPIHPHYPTPKNYRDRTRQHLDLANNCERFFVIDLPSLILQSIRIGPMSSAVLTYLRGGDRAGFNMVMANGFGLGPGCSRNQVGWATFDLNDLLRYEDQRRDLLVKTRERHLVQAWFFCLDQ